MTCAINVMPVGVAILAALAALAASAPVGRRLERADVPAWLPGTLILATLVATAACLGVVLLG